MELSNPLKYSDILDFMADVINVVVIFAIPVIVFFIIYAGFLYVTAKGDPEKVKNASTALTYGVVGGVIIIAAIAIVQIVKNLVEAF